MKTKVAAQSNPDRSPAVERVPDQFKKIPRIEIHPDPDQPRKTFSEASLDELALSIREQGLIQPIIVRMVRPKYRIIEPELHDAKWRIEEADYAHEQPWLRCAGFDTDAECKAWMDQHGGLAALTERYVIVAGERRWRACAPREIARTEGEGDVEWKGLDEIPCLIRDVDEQRKFAQQWVENNARENVCALDEARALSGALFDRKKLDPKFKAEDLARELGMSRAGLYGRMALTRLHPPVQEALAAGKISTSVASVVAQIPNPKQQEELLKIITNEDHYKFPFSVRDVQSMVDNKFVKDLNQAVFDVERDNYPTFPADQLANVACKHCPHRTGNMLELFPHLKSRPNVCTFVNCFDGRTRNHYQEEADKLLAKGEKVLTEAAFKKTCKDYLPGRRTIYAENKQGTLEELMGKYAPDPVNVLTEEGVVQFFPPTDVETAMKKNGVKLYKQQTAEESEEEKKREEAGKLVAQAKNDMIAELLPQIAKALEKVKDAAAWEALELFGQLDTYLDENLEELLKTAKSAKAKVLAWTIAANYKDPVTYDGKWVPEMVKAWKLLGIDLVEEFKAVEAKGQKVLPTPAKTNVQGKLLDLKKGKRQAIMQAQKARWAKVTKVKAAK